MFITINRSENTIIIHENDKISNTSQPRKLGFYHSKTSKPGGRSSVPFNL